MSGLNGREIIAPGARAGVLLPLVFGAPFDYRVPEGMELEPGDWVRVPFGNKPVWGVVWGRGEGEVEEKKIKTIEARAAHLPPMSDVMRSFIDWVAWYTLGSRGMVLKMALPVPEALEEPKKKNSSRKVGRGTAVATSEQRSPHPAPRPLGGGIKSSVLSPAQSAAAAILRAKLSAGFSVTLLDGVTGSGKTEVYFDAIAATLAQGQQALVLLPEIALSVQWLARFKERFGFAPLAWHSGVTPAKRREAWRAVASGEAPVVIGARSALFLPFAKLKLIVIDEEHDASYKQEDGVIYQARDMAVARAYHEKIPAVLVSATPSLETEFNIAQKRYGRVHLPHRHGEAEMPKIRLIDMRGEKLALSSWLSQPLKDALIATIAQGSQAMLFMNRRGYAPLMLCRACGHRFQCPHCAAYLVLHRARGRLICHHCGHLAAPPKACPECKKENMLIPFGPGVERIAEEARALMPDARIAVMTSDQIDTPAKADALVTAMTAGEIDILVGTQMIAKGHHFAGLALVGVLDADMGLSGGDLRAGERTYQLLHQLSGRAGREKIKGEVWLQTYMPGHPVMQALLAGDRDRFMALEASQREDALMPPYGKLAAVIVEGRDEREVAGFARMLASGSHGSSPLILGPAPAPLTLLRGKYRYRILIKATKGFALQEWLANWLKPHKIPPRLKVKIDVEPYSFL